MNIFNKYACYYNLFYQDKDYQKEAIQIDMLLKKFTNVARTIIDLGCGTGNHDLFLYKLGYSITGIDISKEMINIAEKEAKKTHIINLPFYVADIRNYKSTETFDVVISLFHVISYQNSNFDLLRTFKTAANLLEDDGIFIFDVWYGPGVLRDLPTIRVKNVNIDKYEMVRIAKPIIYPIKNIVDVNYDIYIIDKLSGISHNLQEIHTMRYFFTPEIEFFLLQAGFEMLECIDCQTLGEPDFNTWTAYFIAKKIPKRKRHSCQ